MLILPQVSYFDIYFNLLIGTLCLICLLDTGKLDIYELVPVGKKLNEDPIDFGVDSSLTGWVNFVTNCRINVVHISFNINSDEAIDKITLFTSKMSYAVLQVGLALKLLQLPTTVEITTTV